MYYLDLPRQSVVFSFILIPGLFSQDGEIDLKLLTKVLAPEQEVKEVSGFFPVNIVSEFPPKNCAALVHLPPR